MSPVKRFLLIYFVVYLVGGVAAVVLYGPPGMSRAYLTEGNNRDDHARYIEFTKHPDYKLHRENPRMHPAEGEVAEMAAFVEEYTARPAFRAEQRRVLVFNLFFEFYTFGAVVVLIVRFARKPLLSFLDARVEDVRHKIEQAAQRRAEAARERAGAETRLDEMGKETAQIDAQTQALVDQAEQTLEESLRSGLEQIAAEIEARKRLEERHAALRVKSELVSLAVDRLAQELKTALSSSDRERLLDDFVAYLERNP